MKKLIVLIMVLALALVMFTGPCQAQNESTIYFNNRVPSFGVSAPIYDLSIGGTLLEGTGYWAQLWGSPTNSSILEPIGQAVNFRTGLAAGFVDVGTEGSRFLPFQLQVGEKANFSIYAWTDFGSLSYKDTYAAALQSGNMSLHFGNSPILTIEPTTYPIGSIPLLPANLIGLQSFAIQPIPEPPVAALIGLCVFGTMLYRMRR